MIYGLWESCDVTCMRTSEFIKEYIFRKFRIFRSKCNRTLIFIFRFLVR